MNGFGGLLDIKRLVEEKMAFLSGLYEGDLFLLDGDCPTWAVVEFDCVQLTWPQANFEVLSSDKYRELLRGADEERPRR